MAKLMGGRKRLALVSGVVLSLAVATGAFAYWTQSGSGTGSAAAGTTQAITVNQTSTVAGLYPGGPAQALSGNFTNPNSGKVYVAGVTAVVDSTWSAKADTSLPACSAADFTIAGTSNVPGEIASGTNVGSWSGLTIALNDNTSANQDNCKNVTPKIIYTSN